MAQVALVNVHAMNQIFAFLAFSVGVFAPAFFLDLPSDQQCIPGLMVALCLSLVFCCFRIRFSGLSICLLLGLGYGIFTAKDFNQSIWPHSLSNQWVVMTGRIQGLPYLDGDIWRIDFVPDSLRLADPESPSDAYDLPGKVRLSYYGYLDKPLVSGEELRIEAKLKRPHGLKNPGLFDYQRWLIGQGYGATGYIKTLIERDDPRSWLSGIDRWRTYLAGSLGQSAVPYLGVQSALLVGDRSGIASEHMDLFVDTGTVHLMVISGLHIGFAAAIGFFVARWLLSLVSILPGFAAGMNTIRWAYLAALMSALGYSAAAGFSVPTVRAVIMLFALLVPRFFYLKTSPWWGLSLALAFIALTEPLAPLKNGFWLSFGAVFLIFFSLRNQTEEAARSNPVMALARIQLVFLVGFSTMVLLLQGQLNLASFFANMLAVPLVGTLIVPLEMIGLVAFYFDAEFGVLFWDMAGRVIDLLIRYLQFLNQNLQWNLTRNPLPLPIALISVAAGLVFFGLKTWKQRMLAFALMCPAFVPVSLLYPAHFFLEVRFFDVGQGLAVLVRQPGYQLLYDTGPRFSDNFDAGKDILAPSLAQLGIKQLDDLVISHPDSDHMGGYWGLVEHIAVNQTWLGRQPENQRIASAQECLSGNFWKVGGVRYEFLYPYKRDLNRDQQTDNDRSCVLKISFGNQQILLPGDITADVEKQLLREEWPTPVSLVAAPHHGSKSSSSLAFLSRIKPEAVVFSSGYLNRFGHPHPSVVERYQALGSRIHNTAADGMVRFLWLSEYSEPGIETQAERQIFWWQK